MANKAVNNETENTVVRKEETNMADQNQVKPEGSEASNPPATENNNQNPPAAPEPPKEGWFKRNWKKVAAIAGAAAAAVTGIVVAEKYGEGRGACKAIASLPVALDYQSEDDSDDGDDLDDIPEVDITEI